LRTQIQIRKIVSAVGRSEECKEEKGGDDVSLKGK